MENKTMTSGKLLGFLGALTLALLFIASVSASSFGQISSIEVNGVEASNGANIAAFAGQVLPVKIVFTASDDATDVRVKAWIAGERDYAVSSDRFDVLANRTYSRVVLVQIPSNIDPSENFDLEVSIESKDMGTISETLNLAAQRESYTVEVLDVNVDPKVTAGDNLALDVVLKNRGRHEAEDTFLRATIPALGIEQKAYFGDLSSVDQSDPDKNDAAERRLFLKIPANAPAGVYTVVVEAYNADSTTTLERKIAVVGASENSMVVPSTTAKSFAVGDTASYSLTLVNSGDRVRVYNVMIDAPTGLTVDADESVVAIPAGTSKTIRLNAQAAKAGTYNFIANVNSDGELIKSQSFTATVEGKSSASGVTSGGNATVLLTVILAIIFVVLLVVLIVLLTRRPVKTEEFGESYY